MISNIASAKNPLAPVSKGDEKAKLIKEKQDFFKLYLTTMQNQDPTNPTDASSLAQTTMLFQNTSHMIDIKIMLSDAISNSSQDFSNMASLFNDNVDLRLKSNEMYFNNDDKANKAASVDYELPHDMKEVTFTVKNVHGQVVSTEAHKSKTAGIHSFNWSGEISSQEDTGDNNKSFAQDGLYKVEITGTTYNDQKVTVQSFVRAVPQSYAKDGSIIYHLANSNVPKNAHKNDIVGYTRVNDGSAVSTMDKIYNSKKS